MNGSGLLLAEISSAGNASKLLLLALAGVGLLLLARWASRLGEQSASVPHEPDHPFPPKAPLVDPADVLATFPIEPSLGPVRMTKFFFRDFDAIPGPPDPEAFADELSLELYDAKSDHRWTQSYFVASPSGLMKVLRERQWRYLYAAEILVFPRYDLDEIRRAVVSRIVEDGEWVKTEREWTKEESI